MLKKVLFCIFVSISFESCTTISVQSFVESYGNHPEVEARTYFIEAISPGVDRESLQFAKYANTLEKLLVKHGYHRIEDDNDADVIVLLSYRSEKIETSYLDNKLDYSEREATLIPTGATIGDDGIPSTTYARTDRPKISRYKSVIKYNHSFRKQVIITAYKNVPVANFRNLKVHWKINITSEGDRLDMDQAFPFMLTAADAHIGRSFFYEKVIQTKADNPLLRSLLKNEKEGDSAVNKEALEEALP